VGYLIRSLSGSLITAFTTSGVVEQGTATGYYRVSGGVSVPDEGAIAEFYLSVSGTPGAFLSAVTIDPASVSPGDSRLAFLDRAISSREPRYGWPP
jgi:hypothetical protein